MIIIIICYGLIIILYRIIVIKYIKSKTKVTIKKEYIEMKTLAFTKKIEFSEIKILGYQKIYSNIGDLIINLSYQKLKLRYWNNLLFKIDIWENINQKALVICDVLEVEAVHQNLLKMISSEENVMEKMNYKDNFFIEKQTFFSVSNNNSELTYFDKSLLQKYDKGIKIKVNIMGISDKFMRRMKLPPLNISIVKI